MDQFVGSLHGYLARGAGTGAFSAAIQRQNILRGVAEGATFGVATTVGNFGATNLGQAYNYGEGELSYAQHKFGHMVLGGALGAMISKDHLKGALIGGLSAAGAEVVAEALMGDVKAQVIDLREAGFTSEETRKQIFDTARFNAEFSKLAAAGIAASMNENVGTALFTANNAVTNNFNPTISDAVEEALKNHAKKLGAFLGSDVKPVIKAKTVTERQIEKQLNEIENILSSKKDELSYSQRCDLLLQRSRLHEAQANLQRLPTTNFEVAAAGIGAVGNVGPTVGNTVKAGKVINGIRKVAQADKAANNTVKNAGKLERAAAKPANANIKKQAVPHSNINALDLAKPTNSTDLFLNGGQKPIHTKSVTPSRVKPINGQLPKNYGYANDIFPLERLPSDLRGRYPHSVPFTDTGHPDFSRYAIKKVRIEMTGNHKIDNMLANKAAGISAKPEGYTWHHHHDGKTMMLVDKELHKAVKHTGGVAIKKGDK